MKADQRIGKLFGSLTARERGVMALRSMKECTDGDPEIKQTMPDSQTREFNRLVSLMNGVSRDLGPHVLLMKALVGQAGIRLAWLLTLNLPAMRGNKSLTAIADGLAQGPMTLLRAEIKCRWQETRAVEIVMAEVAEEFDGEDPMLPWLRSAFEQAKTELTDITETLVICLGIETEMPEPTEDDLDQVRRVVHRELTNPNSGYGMFA